jgi:hypothetical protein
MSALCSHVDLRTQHSYQAMDPHFVGLIFSVYNSDPLTMVETRDLIAFQAKEDSQVWILCDLELRIGLNHENHSHPPSPHENDVFPSPTMH